MLEIKNIQEFSKCIKNNDFVLVNVGAEWCGPCKRLKPYLRQIENEYKDVQFIRIDIDEAEDLAQNLQIGNLPTTFLVKDNKKSKYIMGANIEQIILLLKNRNLF